MSKNLISGGVVSCQPINMVDPTVPCTPEETHAQPLPRPRGLPNEGFHKYPVKFFLLNPVTKGVLLKSPGVDYSEEGGLKVGYQVGYNLLWEACPNRPIIPPMMGVLIMGKCTNKIEAKVYIPPQEVVVWVTTVDTVILK